MDDAFAPGAPGELAPPEVFAQATALVREFPECFWFWRSDARITSLSDVRLVVEHLRRHGDRRAWAAAQDLHRCLLQSSRRTS
jgi:hypothetical protein